MAKVLLVEDDNNLREIYEARLQAEGYDIVSASDGEQALVVAKNERPDLVISDVMMPKISGFEMLDILRNTDGLKDVKVIMLTALGQAEDKTRADSLGADKYLVKSQVTLEDIVKTAHQLLDDTPTPPPVVTATAPVAPEPANVPSSVATPAAPIIPEPTIPVVTAPPIIQEPVVAPEPVAEPATTTQAMPDPNTSAPANAPAVEEQVVTPTEEPAIDAAPSVPPVETPAIITEAIEAAAAVPAELPSEADINDPEAAVTPPPTASEEPSIDVAPAADAAASQSESSATEAAAMEAQIADFESQPAIDPAAVVPTVDTADADEPVQAPPEAAGETVPPTAPSLETTPTPSEAQVSNDKITAEAVESLTAAVQQLPGGKPSEVTAVEVPPATPSAPTPPAPMVTPPPAADNDNVTIAHKKIIAPISDMSVTGKKDLGDLLAAEEAKLAIPPPATSSVVLPAADATPQVSTPPYVPSGSDIDPSSIAL